MATMPPVVDPRFEPDYGQPDESKPKRSPWTTCLIGCLIILVVLAVLAVILAIFVAQHLRGWTADAGSHLVKETIAQSGFPQQEQDDMNVQVDRLTTAFREKRISWQDGARLMENLVRSPLMTSFLVSAIDRRYLTRSGLSEEEKAAGKITLERFVLGMINKSINEQGIDSAMRHVATKNQNGGWEIRQQLSDADLRAFLAAAKAEADQAGVPEEPEDVDPSDELKRIVDQALGQPAIEMEPAERPDASAEPGQQ